VSQVLAALWLLGLYAAAPALRQSTQYDFPDRLRDALILGVAIPLALGAVGMLYPAACFGALLLAIAIADIRRREPRFAKQTLPPDPPYILIAALLLVGWPQLMRPLLDGDSLSYHLPNAASWVQAHSIWTSATRYWWYPPASELFAAALYAAGGPFALPYSGLCALALLGFRCATWAREFGASPLLADALAAAIVTAYPLAIQGGTLQNDVWLAAFWLETLWALRPGGGGAAAARSAALTALIKPQGWLFTLIALLAGRARFRVWRAAAAALCAWVLRDALLAKGAAISPAAAASFAHPYASTILAHGAAALWLLVIVAARLSPFALLAICAAAAGPLIARDRRSLGWAALAAVVVFSALPFGYETAVAQLATGASLRFAAPAIVLGALLLTPGLRRAAIASTVVLLCSTVFGAWYVLAIFWNDGSTHVALLAAALGAAVAAATRAPSLRGLRPLAVGLAVIFTIHYAGRHPIDYYDDALRVGDTRPGVYRWIASTHPARIGGDGLRLGVVNVLSPSTQTRDLPDDRPCAYARRARVLLVAVAQNDLTPSANSQRLGAAHACGHVVYADPIGVVATPPKEPLRFSSSFRAARLSTAP
jgi:hypothetical protein